MPESASFIPKRNTVQTNRSVRRYNFFLLTIISYALFVAAPLASAAVFIYSRHTQNVFNKSVNNLDEAIQNFKRSDLDRVVSFDNKLQKANQLIKNHVSVLSLLKILEANTAATIKFDSLEITRINQSSLLVDAELETSSLDGVLFQRSFYNNKEVTASSSLTDVKLPPAGIISESLSKNNSSLIITDESQKMVKLKAVFNFSAEQISYQPFSDATTVPSVTISNGSDTSNESVEPNASSSTINI